MIIGKGQGQMLRYMIFFCLLLISTAEAEKAVRGFNISQSAGGQLNYPGALFTTHFFYRIPLSEKVGILTESTKLDIGLCNEFAPAFENPGIFLQIEPIAFFDVAVHLNYVYFYKGLGFGYIALDSYKSKYDADAIMDSTQKNEHGLWLRLSPTLKGMYGNFLFANTFTMHYFTMQNDSYYLERITNSPLAKNDYVLTNDLFILYSFTKPLIGGLNYYFHAVPQSETRTHRLSLVGIYNKKIMDRTNFSAVFMAGSYLEHDYYKMKDVFGALQLQISYRFGH